MSFESGVKMYYLINKHLDTQLSASLTVIVQIGMDLYKSVHCHHRNSEMSHSIYLWDLSQEFDKCETNFPLQKFSGGLHRISTLSSWSDRPH